MDREQREKDNLAEKLQVEVMEDYIRDAAQLDAGIIKNTYLLEHFTKLVDWIYEREKANTSECKMDCMLEWLRNTRREIIKVLNDSFKNGVLTQKERDVLYFRNIDWNSLENCAKQFGVTRERIRQIEAKALEKIRCTEL